ncbi:ImmA/IrrE family metallo-endopeptidase [Nesterenkonia natronophila]|uniref:ImmA/IrrE family metallo-endopeptidase n=1 Tax=Nesterenkonia natronophila TaxID=2174932 RepID=A0A3A4F3L0_9MICC|nr:ImmA/IrrE family metallo-endopeptidase [Nesterenkonia natronophila]RJN32932.1 ImmA/IrrE family metallo-endopeptidase [Nesterenkonia natronophila]
MELEDYAYALGVQIVSERPFRGAWGDYCNSTLTIRLRPDLGPLQREYTLGHELGHAYHEHFGCHQRMEWDADVFAATMLIRRSEWSQATQAHDTVGAVATDLGVLPKVVRIYHEHIGRDQRHSMVA